VWQLVHASCSRTRAAASVGFGAWQEAHADERTPGLPMKSWGAWHVRHESWPAGFGPVGVAWQVLHVARVSLADLCGAWQSVHPLAPRCSACRVERSSWQAVHARLVEAALASPCGLWQSVHVVVACASMPCALS
jgi:hypothetical protein